MPLDNWAPGNLSVYKSHAENHSRNEMDTLENADINIPTNINKKVSVKIRESTKYRKNCVAGGNYFEVDDKGKPKRNMVVMRSKSPEDCQSPKDRRPSTCRGALAVQKVKQNSRPISANSRASGVGAQSNILNMSSYVNTTSLILKQKGNYLNIPGSNFTAKNSQNNKTQGNEFVKCFGNDRAITKDDAKIFINRKVPYNPVSEHRYRDVSKDHWYNRSGFKLS